MDQDSVHMVVGSKVPILKPGEYDLWRRRMEKYIQMVDYSLWKFIKNGNAPLITLVIEGVETIIAPTTAEEKAQRRAPRSQDTKHKESTKRTVLVEIPASAALVSCDGLGGYDWSDQAEEGPTNFALMAYSSTSSNSEVSTDSNCSSSCLEIVKILKEHNEQLLKDLRTSKINVITYKTGLESVEARLLFYMKNELDYEEDIKILKREIHLREIAIIELRRKLELAQKQKDEIQLTVENFKNLSKNLSKLIDCQIVDKCKTGLGYNVVPPPYTGKFLPPKPDLFGLEDFVNEPIVTEPTVKKPAVETSEAKASADKSKVVRKNFGPPLIKDWISDSEDEAESKSKIEKKTVKPSFPKIEFVKSKEQVKSLGKLLLNKNTSFKLYETIWVSVTIFNTKDHLSKFDGKADKGFFVGYSLNSNAFRVFSNKIRIVEENLHIRLSESTPNIAGSGPNWLFDIDALTKPMNYKSVVAGYQSNDNIGTKACNDAESKSYQDDGLQPSSGDGKKVDEDPIQESECKEDNVNITNNVNVVGTNGVNAVVSPTLTTRIHKDHLIDQVIGNLHSTTQIRNMSKNLEEHGFVTTIHQRTNHKDLQNYLFTCSLSQEPKKTIHALKDPSWIEAMHEELLQFKLQEVWTLVDLPYEKRDIGTKWVFQNKKDERGIMIRNKARLVSQGHTQEEGIDYDEVFALIVRIEAIRLFLAYSFKDFVVYQMDVKSAFLYGKIKEEVYVCQPPGFKDPNFPDKVYKVEKVLYGLHQTPRAWYETLSKYLLDNRFYRGKIDKTFFIKRHKYDILLVQVYVDDIIFGSTKKELCNAFEKMIHEKFQMSSMGELTFFLGLQVKQKQDGIFISQDKYVVEILKKYGFSKVKNASTPMETQKHLLRDEDGKEVDVYMYRSMIGSLMYLTSSRPDIMFAVCACARYQVNQKVSHLHAVKRIFRKSARLIMKERCVKDRKSDLATVKAKIINGEVQLQALVDGKKADNEEMDDSLERAATTTTSLDTEHDRGVNTPRSGEDSLKHNESMELCTKLQQRVLDLETTKTTQALEIKILKRRVKKLERRKMSRTHRLKRLYKNVPEEVVDDVAQPTSPLPPSPVIPSTPPHQSPSPPQPQAKEGLSQLVQQ
nr:putative ribonuclease H-like domain-containing protein [Tanacetum cinerariifolium]